ncbi:MAG: translocation/assembly module TamB domain-containing protein [Rhizobacter sp.]
MSEQTASPETPATPAPVRRRRWRMLLGLGTVLLVLLLGGGLAGSLLWVAGTPAGTLWVLARLSSAGIGVEVIEPDGVLLGDLKAKQVIVTASGTRIVIDRPSWHNMSAHYTPYPESWVALHADRLSADRVTITVTTPSDGKPFTLPPRLRLPLELRIDDLKVAELLVPGLEGKPLRDVQAKLALGDKQGREHRVEQLSVRLDPLRISGQASIGADAPMTLTAALKAVQSDATPATPGPVLPGWAKTLQPDWRAELTAKGPLAKFDLQAQLRAQGQSLDATAQVAPAEPWPLPRLQATTQGLDLAALLAKAPATALSGEISITPAEGKNVNAVVKLQNAKPGRWDMQQLPVRSLSLDLRAHTDHFDKFELAGLDAVLSDGHKDAGHLQGKGQWNAGDAELHADLTQLQPSALDPRLAAMTLSGPITLSAQRAAPAANGKRPLPHFKALADLKGRLNAPDRPVQLRLEASGNEERIELHELRASVGEAHATLKAQADRGSDAWQLKSEASLVDFDPRPWFPLGPGGGWQAGQHRINLDGKAALNLPDSLWPGTGSTPDTRHWTQRVAAIQGDAHLKIDNTVLASTALSGDIDLQHTSTKDALQVKANLDMAGNRIKAEGQLTPDAQGRDDRWSAEVRAPALARLTPLLRALLTPELANELLDGFSGTLDADAQVTGRWPAMTTEGKASLANTRAGVWSVGQASLHWQAGTGLDAPLDVQVDIGQAAWDKRQLGASSLALKGTPRNHELTMHAELKAAPPAWVDGVQGRPAPTATHIATPTGAAASAPGAAASAPADAVVKANPPRTLVLVNAHGGAAGGLFSPPDARVPFSWKGVLQQFELRTTEPGTAPLLLVKDVGFEWQSGDTPRAIVSAGHADILGAGLRWNRIEWVAGRGIVTQQLDMQAELEPLAVAPLLRRIQPNFGWGGDLQIAGKVIIKQADQFSADIVLERTRGDLTVTEEGGTQSLGLTDLRIGLNAQDGVWNFTAGLAGAQLGVLGGAVVVRTSPQLAWPAADAPLQGVLEAQVANLGTWGPWVPAGWRLGGKLNVSASLGGRVNAPEYTGMVKGSEIGVRNMLEGVSITDGEVDISLRGDTAKINKLTARGGNGTISLDGDARLDNGWRARLNLSADKFQALGRVDLRIVTSGKGQVVIENDTAKAEGRFVVDEGLVDFTRLSSPSLSSDVVVVSRAKKEEAPPAPGTPATSKVSLDLTVNLGNQLRMRGLGIDTRLEGELKVTLPNGKWALNGTVRALDGTFANYGQKLVIDKGVIVFNGAPSDMRLDIEATRPDLDNVRVGVKVTGPLAALRVRLFSEPSMTDNEKLSWLLLGRASDGLGRSDTALLQRAAFALLAGDGDGGPAQITKAIGIDDVGLRQNEIGETKETVVSVGKHLSKRVYVAYEQNLSTSTGSLQVTYRIAQRFVMRLQSGLDRSIDLIGTWRWE